jgi:hypothetical protein
MKKLVFVILLLFGITSILNAQTYEKSMKFKDFGSWDKVVSPANKISISSYITKRKNLTGISQSAIANSPKYQYELVLQSKSVYNGNLTKTWIYGAKVFIDSLEVTHDQSPDGFTAIINTEPTIIYRYDSSLDTINIKITWKSSQYFQSK